MSCLPSLCPICNMQHCVVRLWCNELELMSGCCFLSVPLQQHMCVDCEVLALAERL